VAEQFLHGRSSNRDDALLVAFTQDDNRAVLQINVADTQTQQFARPEPGRVQQLKHRFEYEESE
jgi:hypothetical protein